ncbi:hypothetical protein BJY00DRAFT_312350 [Aspergillus carlsbadensis]|nr:hypothetical protein BJY00DRAFT_312350 [Aspergillus carlsbadensis]
MKSSQFSGSRQTLPASKAKPPPSSSAKSGQTSSSRAVKSARRPRDPWADLADAQGLSGTTTHSAILDESLSLADCVRRHIGPAFGVSRELAGMEVLESILRKVDRSTDKLARYIGPRKGASLPEMISSAVRTFEDQRTELDALKAEYKDAEMTMATLQTANQMTEEENMLLKLENDTYKEEQARVDERMEAISRGLNQFAEYIQLPGQECTPDGVVAFLDGLLARAQEENNFLPKAMCSAAQRQTEAREVEDAALRRVDEVTGENDELRGQNEELRGENNELREENDELWEENEELQEENEELRDDKVAADFVTHFREMYDSILSACELFYHPDPTKAPDSQGIRGSVQFRDAVTLIWHHLCAEFWSRRPALDAGSQMILSAGEPRHNIWAITKHPCFDGARDRVGKLEVDLLCIFAAADRLWADLRHNKCSAYISPALGDLTRGPIPYPLVVVQPANKQRRVLGYEALLEVS